MISFYFTKITYPREGHLFWWRNIQCNFNERIKERLPELRLESLEREKSDSKEAVAFAILANETLSGRAGSIPAITGVLRPSVLGEIGL